MTKAKSQTKQTLDSLFWMSSGQGLYYIANLFITAVMTRLLTPVEFGSVAAAMLIVKFAETFSMMGIGPALIQRPEINQKHMRVGFTLACLLGLLLFTAVWFLAPFIAGFFQVAEFTAILRTLILIFPLRSVGVVAESLLARQLKFKYLALINFLSKVVGYGLAAIVLALMGLSVWAIVYGTLVGVALQTVLLLYLQPYPKRFLWDTAVFKQLIGFGGGVTITTASEYFSTEGDNLIISWGLGARALGIYGRAYNLISMPVNLIGRVLDQVLFPAMAALQQDTHRIKKTYTLGLAATALLTVPISITLFILAPEIIIVLLGPNWVEMVPIFQLLTSIIYFQTAYKVSASLIRAAGAVYRQAWLQTIYASLVITGSLVGLRWGPIGVAAGVVIAAICHYLLMLRLSSKLIVMAPQDWVTVLRPLAFFLPTVTLPLYFTVTQLRQLQVNPFIIIVGSLVVLGLFLLSLFRLNPYLVLGDHGITLVKLLFTLYGRKTVLLPKLLSYILGKKFVDTLYA